MGFRIVVVLSNDQMHEWSKDPALGAKIVEASSYRALPPSFRSQALPYGDVVQVAHADTQSVIACDGYSGWMIASTNWYAGQTTNDKHLQMLKAHAEALGYRVVKKPTKVAPAGAVRTTLQD